MTTSASVTLLCRSCRKPFLSFPPAVRLGIHGERLPDYLSKSVALCGSSDGTSASLVGEEITTDLPHVYVDTEFVPPWIIDVFSQNDWSKGGLKCETCSANLGSFDFVTGRRCDCGEALLPCLRITRSKVDEKINLSSRRICAAMFQLLLPETACDLWEGKSGLLTGVVDTLSDISGEDKTVIYICSLCSTSSTVLPNERVVGWLNTSSNDSSLLNLVSCSNGTVREKAVCVSLRIVKTSEGSIQMNVKFCAAIPHLGNVEFREIPDAACVIISFPLEDVQRCQFLCRSAESNMDETFPGLQRALGLSPPMDNIQTISEEVDDSFHSPIRRKVERFFLLSSFICQLKDRARQVAMVSSAISSVSPCRPLSLSVGNVLVCILLDVFAASILLRYTSLSTLTPQELLVAFLNNTNDVVEFLRNLLDWIMGVPIGLKLNEPVNQALGTFFHYHIHLWTTYIDVIRPVLLLLLRLLLHSSFLGVTIQLSIFRDLLALATFHVYCFYVYAAKLFNIQFSALMALWRLFRGKRWNPLLQRLDPYPYQIDQLFLGTLAFTVFFFLLPTTVVYYIVFTALRLLLLILEGCLYRLQYFLNVVPIYAFWLWLMRSPKICGSVQLSLASPLPMSSSGHSESHNLILRSSLAPFPLLTSLKMTVPSVPQAPTSPALAKTIHSLFLGRIIYPL